MPSIGLYPLIVWTARQQYNKLIEFGGLIEEACNHVNKYIIVCKLLNIDSKRC